MFSQCVFINTTGSFFLSQTQKGRVKSAMSILSLFSVDQRGPSGGFFRGPISNGGCNFVGNIFSKRNVLFGIWISKNILFYRYFNLLNISLILPYLFPLQSTNVLQNLASSSSAKYLSGKKSVWVTLTDRQTWLSLTYSSLLNIFGENNIGCFRHRGIFLRLRTSYEPNNLFFILDFIVTCCDATN